MLGQVSEQITKTEPKPKAFSASQYFLVRSAQMEPIQMKMFNILWFILDHYLLCNAEFWNMFAYSFWEKIHPVRPLG